MINVISFSYIYQHNNLATNCKDSNSNESTPSLSLIDPSLCQCRICPNETCWIMKQTLRFCIYFYLEQPHFRILVVIIIIIWQTNSAGALRGFSVRWSSAVSHCVCVKPFKPRSYFAEWNTTLDFVDPMIKLAVLNFHPYSLF